MEPHIARNKISRNPTKQVLFTGQYDDAGEPIYRASGEKIMPGSVFFPADEDERTWLIGLNSARLMTPEERALWSECPEKTFPIDVS